MIEDQLFVRIQQCFSNAFGVKSNSIHINLEPDDIDGWDSMGHVNLITEIEKEFDCRLDIDEVMDMENVKAVCNIIKGKFS